MSSTKKVQSAGRYHARYGVGIRRRLLKVEGQQKKPVACPSCGFSRVSRQAPGIFWCKKCNAQFAGGAYFPQTLTGSIVSKMVSQKSFLSNVGELLHTQETKTEEPKTKEAS